MEMFAEIHTRQSVSCSLPSLRRAVQVQHVWTTIPSCCLSMQKWTSSAAQFSFRCVAIKNEVCWNYLVRGKTPAFALTIKKKFALQKISCNVRFLFESILANSDIDLFCEKSRSARVRAFQFQSFNCWNEIKFIGKKGVLFKLLIYF